MRTKSIPPLIGPFLLIRELITPATRTAIRTFSWTTRLLQSWTWKASAVSNIYLYPSNPPSQTANRVNKAHVIYTEQFQYNVSSVISTPSVCKSRSPLSDPGAVDHHPFASHSRRGQREDQNSPCVPCDLHGTMYWFKSIAPSVCTS